MSNELPSSWLDWAVKTVLGVLGAILGWMWKDTRGDIIELRARMDAQEKALAVLSSSMDGKQNLLLEKIEGMEHGLLAMTHALADVSEKLTNLRIEQGRRVG